MLGKKIVSFKKLAKKVSYKKLAKKVSLKKLAKKVKSSSGTDPNPDYQEFLLKEYEGESSNTTTPVGFFALYVGEEHQRFVVPTSYLSHPLFKMLLEKAYNEFGFAQRSVLLVPCSVSTFQEVLNAIECNKANFDLCKIFEESL